mmetsp:Transcript_63295/g.175050  ORF Transcript_63295/g.175050 Transcript_63295/m.175050 type:complete len:322 (+) Transcript_63295:322-1287(+)
MVLVEQRRPPLARVLVALGQQPLELRQARGRLRMEILQADLALALRVELAEKALGPHHAHVPARLAEVEQRHDAVLVAVQRVPPRGERAPELRREETPERCSRPHAHVLDFLALAASRAARRLRGGDAGSRGTRLRGRPAAAAGVPPSGGPLLRREADEERPQVLLPDRDLAMPPQQQLEEHRGLHHLGREHALASLLEVALGQHLDVRGVQPPVPSCAHAAELRQQELAEGVELSLGRGVDGAELQGVPLAGELFPEALDVARELDLRHGLAELAEGHEASAHRVERLAPRRDGRGVVLRHQLPQVLRRAAGRADPSGAC